MEMMAEDNKPGMSKKKKKNKKEKEPLPEMDNGTLNPNEDVDMCDRVSENVSKKKKKRKVVEECAVSDESSTGVKKKKKNKNTDIQSFVSMAETQKEDTDVVDERKKKKRKKKKTKLEDGTFEDQTDDVETITTKKEFSDDKGGQDAEDTQDSDEEKRRKKKKMNPQEVGSLLVNASTSEEKSKKRKHKKASVTVETYSEDESVQSGKKEKKKVEDQHTRVDLTPPSPKDSNTGEKVNQGLGQWSTAQFNNSQQRDKFLRLMGGFKSGFQKASAGTDCANMALGAQGEKNLQQGLLGQFQRARSIDRGAGLGFGSTTKKFSIDPNARRSVLFDD